MVKVTLEVPEEVATLLKAMEAKLQAEAKAAREFAPVDPEGALRNIDAAAEALSLEGKRRLLQGYDADAPRLLIDSAPHARVGRYT
ncbi:ISKra4 family transposase, partial [Myxococcus fulvus]|nr:ISKra4 family transposase [Myxococcus fulvus]